MHKVIDLDGRDKDVCVRIWVDGGHIEIIKNSCNGEIELRGVGESVASSLSIRPIAANVCNVRLTDLFTHYEPGSLDARKQRTRKKE